MIRLSRRSKITLWTIIPLLLLVTGLYFRGPMHHIQLPAEKVATFGPFVIFNSTVASWLCILLLAAFFYGATRRMELVPRGLQSLAEALLEAMLGVVEQAAGHRYGRVFFPAVATIFLFVLTNNYLGLLPGYGTIGLVEAKPEHGYPYQVVELGQFKIAFLMPGTIEPVAHHEGGEGYEHEEASTLVGTMVPFLRSANTDINTPLAIAIASAIFVEYWGVSTLGLFTYGSKFFNFGPLFRGDIFNGIIFAFIGLIELASEFIRLVSFTFRLFGNIFAGEVVLAVMTFLIPWVAAIPFFGIELFVGFVQALIFALLTLVFGMTAVSHGAEEHAH